jgi:O-acetyl-ADP-ribose deacetylase (regulator of RNase III)
MIEYIKGDLLQAFERGDVDAIAHQCNCFCTLGRGTAKGIAKSIGERYPSARIADIETRSGDATKLGGYSVAKAQRNLFNLRNGLIFNVYGQYRYGNDKQYTDVTALMRGLTSACEYIKSLGIYTIGIPKIGAGRGGAEWSEIEEMILSVSNTTGVNFKVYEID